jgi:protein-tyrosine phosphatase
MIDLHCHMLPGIDDGAPDLDTALEMARIAVADGIVMTACTPHIYPGLFENTAASIAQATATLQHDIQQAGIALEITYGADIQLVPEMVPGLRRGSHPTIHGSRYFLFEPPHHTVPVRFEQSIFDALTSGFVPVITHPERLTWLDDQHYPWFVTAARQGAWIQLTAGALTGRFGRRPRYWSERFLDDGLVHILATDAHEPIHRPPLLAEGREAAVARLGVDEADLLVTGRPMAIIENRLASEVPLPLGIDPRRRSRPVEDRHKGHWLRRLFSA